MDVVRNATSVYTVNANGTYTDMMVSGSDPPINTTCPPVTTVQYDYEGAMKFTVAVVLVYGIGIIGLLGIYTKKKRSAEDKIKEGDMFLRTFEQKRLIMERKSRKSAIAKLVYNVQGIEPKSPTSIIGKLTMSPAINIALPSKASIDIKKLTLKRLSTDMGNEIPGHDDAEVERTKKRVTFESDAVSCHTPLLDSETNLKTVNKDPSPSEYSVVCEVGKQMQSIRRNAITGDNKVKTNDYIAGIHRPDASTRDGSCDDIVPRESMVPSNKSLLKGRENCVTNKIDTVVTDKKFISFLHNESYV